MKTKNIFRSIGVVCAALAASAAPLAAAEAGDWGSFKGRFILDEAPPPPARIEMGRGRGCEAFAPVDETFVVDPVGRGIKNILIFLRTPDPAVHPDYAKFKGKEVPLDLVGCRFQPRVLPVTPDQILAVRNGDALLHNVRASPQQNDAFNRVLRPNQGFQVQFKTAERLPIVLQCDVNQPMRGYVFCHPNPYFAVTDADGAFEIKNLPAGFLEFRVWHETSGYLVAEPDWEQNNVRGIVKATIVDGETKDLGTLKVPLEAFRRP